MRILFLTDNFPPATNAPATRTYEHTRRWVARRHQVTVITGAPNFPSGKVFEGYGNKLLQRGTMDDIDVIRVSTYITKGALSRRGDSNYVSMHFRRLDRRKEMAQLSAS